MTTRRSFLASMPAIVASTTALASCSTAGESYADAATTTWRAFDESNTGRSAIFRELVRFATLAPSSHNTQCWTFTPDAAGITIRPDLSRRCPAVDPDDHHLFVSLGCATENLVQAASAHGFGADVRFDPARDGSIRIELAPTRRVPSSLFAAITHRQSTRSLYDGTNVTAADLSALEAAGAGPGVHVALETARPRVEQIVDDVVAANALQMHDRAFMNELRGWIRFSERAAVTSGDGLFSRASGSPTLPQWLGTAAFPYVFTAKSQDDQYARFIRSSAGVAVFVSDRSGPADWVEAGRSFERVALTATTLGIRTAMINQPIEVASLRGRFANAHGFAGRVNLIARFGYAPEMPRSLRRPVGRVLV